MATTAAIALVLVGMATVQAPPAAADSPRTAVAVDIGVHHACAVLSDSRLKCWGSNASGALGLGNTTSRGWGAGQMGDNLPAVDLGTGRTATAVATAWDSTCALLDHGQVKCWGFNGYGQLGLGDRITRGDGPGEMGDNLPAVDLGTGRTAVAITGSQEGAFCALLDNGQAKCWGSDGPGGLLGRGVSGNEVQGDEPGEMGNNLPPVDLGTGQKAIAITAGLHQICALLDGGQVKCWGGGGYLGVGDMDTRGDGPGEMGDNLPPVDLGSGRTATGVASGWGHTCAVLDNGQVKCWGDGYLGGLGTGNSASLGDDPGEMGANLAPVDLGTGRTATAVAAGTSSSCALLDNGQVKCWGDGHYGQLGLGDTSHRGDGPGEMGNNLPAVDLGSGRTATAIDAGSAHVCALLDNNSVKCWGYNQNGDLGLGGPGHRGDGQGEMGDNLPAVDLGTIRSYQIDGEVKRSADSGYTGAGTYNTTGVGQKVKADVRRGQAGTFDVRFTNRSTAADGITVHGAATSTGFKVRYFVGATEVTTQVVASTYTFADVAAGASADLQVRVKVQAGVPVNATRTVLVTGTSTHDAGKVDAVKAKVRALA